MEFKLEINNRETWGFTNMWKLNNMFLNNDCVKGNITREIRNTFEINKNVNSTQYIKMYKMWQEIKLIAITPLSMTN